MKKITFYLFVISLSFFVLAGLSPSFDIVYDYDSKLASNILSSGIVLGLLIVCFAFLITDLYVFVLFKIKKYRKSKSLEDVENE